MERKTRERERAVLWAAQTLIQSFSSFPWLFALIWLNLDGGGLRLRWMNDLFNIALSPIVNIHRFCSRKGSTGIYIYTFYKFDEQGLFQKSDILLKKRISKTFNRSSNNLIILLPFLCLSRSILYSWHSAFPGNLLWLMQNNQSLRKAEIEYSVN